MRHHAAGGVLQQHVERRAAATPPRLAPSSQGASRARSSRDHVGGRPRPRRHLLGRGDAALAPTGATGAPRRVHRSRAPDRPGASGVRAHWAHRPRSSPTSTSPKPSIGGIETSCTTPQRTHRCRMVTESAVITGRRRRPETSIAPGPAVIVARGSRSDPPPSPGTWDRSTGRGPLPAASRTAPGHGGSFGHCGPADLPPPCGDGLSGSAAAAAAFAFARIRRADSRLNSPPIVDPLVRHDGPVYRAPPGSNGDQHRAAHGRKHRPVSPPKVTAPVGPIAKHQQRRAEGSLRGPARRDDNAPDLHGAEAPNPIRSQIPHCAIASRLNGSHPGDFRQLTPARAGPPSVPERN